MSLASLLSAMFLLALAVLGYRRHSNLLSPAFIHPFCWSLVLFAYSLSFDFFDPVGNKVFLLMTGGGFLFWVGVLIATPGAAGKLQPVKLLSLTLPQTLLMEAITWAPLVVLPFFIKRTHEIAAGGLADSLLINLRYAINVEDGRKELGLLNYASTMSFAAVGLLLISRKRFQVLRLLIAYGVALGFCVVSTGRTSFMLLLALTSGVLTMTGKWKTKQAGIWCLVLGLLNFVVMGYLLQKGATSGVSFRENLSSMLEAFQIYLLSPIAALNTLLIQDLQPTNGIKTFRVAFAILEAFGCDVQVESNVQTFVEVPWATNVYTIYGTYYYDFLYLGALSSQFFLGVWHGFIYRKAVSGSRLFILVYAIFLYPLVMQFFQEQYLTLASQWAQLLAYFGLFFLLGRQEKRA